MNHYYFWRARDPRDLAMAAPLTARLCAAALVCGLVAAYSSYPGVCNRDDSVSSMGCVRGVAAGRSIPRAHARWRHGIHVDRR